MLRAASGGERGDPLEGAVRHEHVAARDVDLHGATDARTRHGQRVRPHGRRDRILLGYGILYNNYYTVYIVYK